MSRRAPAFLGAALLAVALGGVTWQAQRRQLAALPVPTALTAGQPSPPATPVVEPAGASPPSRSPDQRLAAGSPPADPLREGEVEFCGYGRARSEARLEALEQRVAASSDAVQEVVKAHMHASADVHTRAAALMVERNAAPLVEMALRSDDPTLYAFARQTCIGADQAPSAEHCRLLSAEQMARLDPDNLVAWLYVAQDAQRRGDAAGVAEAYHRASLARWLRHRPFAFASLALASLPETLPPGEAAKAVVRVIGIQAAQPLPAYQPLARWCGKDMLATDANRRQVCNRIARTMVERADTMMDLAIGRRIGEFAGWPAEEVELHSARLNGYAEGMSERITSAPGGMYSCESVRRSALWATRASRDGEVTALRAEVEQLGWTDATMLERYRRAVAARAAQAASALSAPR